MDIPVCNEGDYHSVNQTLYMYVHVYNDVTCVAKNLNVILLCILITLIHLEHYYIVSTEVHMSPAQYGASEIVM